MTNLVGHLAREGSGPDSVLDAFNGWAELRGLHLYPAQEEAVLAVLAGDHVIVATPTGSGKSLVALCAHLSMLASGRRSWYSAPIKALVSEKFFDLCAQLGTENVGMLTGDASINPDAPVICCTAEILANLALRYGESAPVDQVVMDEFHFYADPDRGWAWQVPLIELRRAQFVLMSATLGDVSRFVGDFERRTGRPTTVVSSIERPVPLDYRYARTLVHDTISQLAAEGLAPIYAVHFTQKAAVERAQALTSAQLATRAERDAIALAISQSRLAAGFGQALGRFLRHGIGVHHAGMLPKYRRLVERLCQEGLLKVVCGTDTLGVGINVPIRTVLFTGLSKFDGTTSRLLTAREFHQMAGRAGRAGFDSAGSVVVQAPEHVSENDRALARAGDDAAKRRKIVKAKPPKGFVHWDEGTFNRLVAAQPEPLASSFKVTHAMLLEVLDRPGDGCAAMKRLLTDNDDDRPAQRRHIRQAIAIYRSLLAAGVLERLDAPDEMGRRVRLTVDLQEDFALNQPLSLFVLDAIPRLDDASPEWDLDVVSVVESTLEGPRPVLMAQLERLRTEVLAQLKEEGVEYEERMEVLRELEHPKPLADFLYTVFDEYRARHPWARDHDVHPKSIVRDMYERSMSFAEYVAYYGISRSEGLLLRYLSDAYKASVQNVPEDLKSNTLRDLSEWLGEMVRQVDSSLLDEWELLMHPAELEAALARGERPTPGLTPGGEPPPLTSNVRAFRVMVRNASFRRVELAARRDWATLGEMDQEAGWDAGRWEAALAPYFAEHASIGTGPAARGPALWQLSEEGRKWRVRQVLDDPAGFHEWAILLDVDLDASDGRGEPAIVPAGVARI
jgi:superfamily II RNA helicase